METINIKFDEKQLEEVVKKVTEKLKKRERFRYSKGKSVSNVFRI
nr:hypothetical protein [Streptococcus uberis]